MSSWWRRFEVLLPLQFDEGREVPREWLEQLEFWLVSYGIAVDWRASPSGSRASKPPFGEGQFAALGCNLEVR
jgi:hypothetical protein